MAVLTATSRFVCVAHSVGCMEMHGRAACPCIEKLHARNLSRLFSGLHAFAVAAHVRMARACRHVKTFSTARSNCLIYIEKIVVKVATVVCLNNQHGALVCAWRITITTGIPCTTQYFYYAHFHAALKTALLDYLVSICVIVKRSRWSGEHTQSTRWLAGDVY